MGAGGMTSLRRDTADSLARIAARKRRVCSPQEAGWPRRLAWWGWTLVSSAVRPALFLLLAGLSAYWTIEGVRQLDANATPAAGDDRIGSAFAALAPDAGAASSVWSQELNDAMRPQGQSPADTALAASLIAAFEDIVGRERFASLLWAELDGRPQDEAEAILRALPVWVRERELENAWASLLAGSADNGVLALAPQAARNRLERASRLYDGLDPLQTAFFAGHQNGALNLALLPGLADGAGTLWLLSDEAAMTEHCAAGEALECALAQAGADRSAGQGARLMRAALLSGHANAAWREVLEAADPVALRAVASELAAVARHTSNIDAIRLTGALQTLQDVSRLRRLSQEAGPRTLALVHLRGRAALDLDRGEEPRPLLTPGAIQRFALAGVFALLAIGMVLAALASAFSVEISGRAGLGQRLDIRARELLLGRKA